MLCCAGHLLPSMGGPMSSRVRNGSVVQDKRDKVWRFYWWENGKRRSKKLGRFPSKTKAWVAAKPHRDAAEATAISKPSATTVGELVKQYRVEKMPQRTSTRRGYESFLRNYILPKWQDSQITELQARPVEL